MIRAGYGQNNIISILAPAWGASRLGRGPPYPHPISILAPAWGASSAMMTLALNESYFNSRPRVGGVCKLYLSCTYKHISILAPAWGRLPKT